MCIWYLCGFSVLQSVVNHISPYQLANFNTIALHVSLYILAHVRECSEMYPFGSGLTVAVTVLWDQQCM